jgi:hypothetical protein
MDMTMSLKEAARFLKFSSRGKAWEKLGVL